MKTVWAIKRLWYVLRIYPQRLLRLFTYFFHPFYTKPKFRVFPFMLAECLLIFDIYEIISNMLKSNIRPLTEAEILRGSAIFGKSIDYQLVIIDDAAQYVVKDKKIAYVSFNTINSYGALPPDVFIHELMHIWQYQNFGAGYIVQTLWAQRSKAGYNYAYTEGWSDFKSIHQFNGEQQADLVQDYFRLKTDSTAYWQKDFTSKDVSKYEKFIEEIRRLG